MSGSLRKLKQFLNLLFILKNKPTGKQLVLWIKMWSISPRTGIPGAKSRLTYSWFNTAKPSSWELCHFTLLSAKSEMACFPTASSKVMLSDLWIFAQSDRWNVVSQCCFNHISVITGEVHNVFMQLRPFDSLSLWILSTSVFLLDTSGSFLINVYEVETFVVWVRNIFRVWRFAFQWACFLKWFT